MGKAYLGPHLDSTLAWAPGTLHVMSAAPWALDSQLASPHPQLLWVSLIIWVPGSEIAEAGSPFPSQQLLAFSNLGCCPKRKLQKSETPLFGMCWWLLPTWIPVPCSPMSLSGMKVGGLGDHSEWKPEKEPRMGGWIAWSCPGKQVPGSPFCVVLGSLH